MDFNWALDKKWKFRNPSTIVKEEAVSRQGNVEEPSLVLLKLMNEEANLREAKQNLISLREKLHFKLQKEVEDKNINIKKLRAEITNLKIDCEELSKTITARKRLQHLKTTSKKKFRHTLKNQGYSKKAIEEMWKWYDYYEKKGVARD